MSAAPPARCPRSGVTLRVPALRLGPKGALLLGLAVLLAAWLATGRASASTSTTQRCAEPQEQSELLGEPALAVELGTEPLQCTMHERGTSQRADEGRPVYAVPICLAEGASGIAPLPALSIEDHRIEAVPSCGDFAANAPHLRRAGGDPAPRDPPAVHDAALPAHGRVPLRPRPLPVLLDQRPHPGEAAPGIHQRVYRPPRA